MALELLGVATESEEEKPRSHRDASLQPPTAKEGHPRYGSPAINPDIPNKLARSVVTFCEFVCAMAPNSVAKLRKSAATEFDNSEVEPEPPATPASILFI